MAGAQRNNGSAKGECTLLRACVQRAEWLRAEHTMLCSYFADCEARGISPPDHALVTSAEAKERLASETLPLWQHAYGGAALSIDLTSVDEALRSMGHSLKGRGTGDSPSGDIPASLLSYNLVAAAMRQKDFYYNVALPHYEYSVMQMNCAKRCVSYPYTSYTQTAPGSSRRAARFSGLSFSTTQLP